ncbi:MAG: acetyl-CoA carboxylase carboxyltransferase subunit alpha [Candidatus Marinimicrobia bacterium]|mgnify:FL=1|jgi:acetyl-CoA carboxylase carboxyl transferase subunit alpha|nr:acetyl-CoA carboxylase carboxyltransferase subunit alpha [Candidatus Neomarinimicrobiota bacterium]
MANYYLKFEKPVEEIDQAILELEADASSVDHSSELSTLKVKRKASLKKIFSGLSRWQRVQLARHPQRPFSLNYIKAFAPDFIELHGDRHFGDDAAVICGLGTIDNVKVVFIGQQKGRNTKENLLRNFGMMRPEGYRKALRIMKLAEKFNLPVISLIDTPGAYPGIGAEERGQGEAIAKNLWEMSKLTVPIISVIIGEGASGGALGIGVCDRMLMLENTWYSVISPEGCASILWHDAAKAPDAADAMKVIPDDLMNMGICDRIIEEPLGGAHRNSAEMATILKSVLLDEIAQLKEIDADTFLARRIERYDKMGVFTES